MSMKEVVVEQRNPFPGLRPFREDEDYLFFGREKQVDTMVDKLAANHFLAVIGASGSGKSSLVNCGLRPALRGGLMSRAGTNWRMAQLRPGNKPLKALAEALAENGVLFNDYQASGLTLAEVIDTTLRMSKLGLLDIFEQAQLDDNINLLLVVDQFEELFRYRQLADGQQEHIYAVSEEATAFVNLLLTAVEQTDYPIYVVLTMRSDFLGDCAQFNGLSEAINAGQYLVPRMTRDERRAAIRGPAEVYGAEISSVLLTRLVNDVGDNPDQLSILQHALNRTWACWQHQNEGKGPLDLSHYQSIGTMVSALDRHAEKAYAELTTEREQQICEKLFKALTDKATDPRGVRRPTKLRTLYALTEATADEVTAVIDVFRKPSRSFLLPPAGASLENDSVVDISHESLMRVWRRLNTWADEEASSAQMYRRLAETSILHAKEQAALWQDPDLQLALKWREECAPNQVWAERYHPEFESAVQFLNESLAERERSKKTEEQQRQRELTRSRMIACGAIAFSLLLVVIAMVALKAKARADQERRQAEKSMTYMLTMSDQLKGLGKPYLMEYLGQTLDSSVKDDDALSQLIRGRARYLEGQAALEQGETGDYGEALRALVKFDLYKEIARKGLKEAPEAERLRWQSELAVAYQSIGESLHVLSSWPENCYDLAANEKDESQTKYDSCESGLKKTFKHLNETAEYKAVLSDYPLVQSLASGKKVEKGDLSDLRDRAYDNALAHLPQQEEPSAVTVRRIAGIHISIGDHRDVSIEEKKKALSEYSKALRVVEDHAHLDERSMSRELSKINAKIASLLGEYPSWEVPQEYLAEYALVADYLQANQGPDGSYVSEMYANPVDRFIEKDLAWGHERITRDKENYFKYWPESKWFLIGMIKQEVMSADERLLSFPIQYYTNSKKRNETNSGRVKQFLKLRRQGGSAEWKTVRDFSDWKIVEDYQEDFKRE